MASGLEQHQGANAVPNAKQRAINAEDRLRRLKLGTKPAPKDGEVATTIGNEARNTETQEGDVSIESLRKQAIADLKVPISGENFQKILDLRVKMTTVGNAISMETINSIVNIPFQGAVTGSLPDVSPADEMYFVSKINPKIHHSIAVGSKMETGQKEAFLKDFPITQLYRAFAAADDRLKQIGAKKKTEKFVSEI